MNGLQISYIRKKKKKITTLARDSKKDAAVLAAGVRAVAHFDEKDAKTLERAVAEIAPDILFYASHDTLPHIDAIIDGLAAQGKTPSGRLPVLILEGKTKVWSDLNEDDVKSLPTDAPHHHAKHQKPVPPFPPRRIDGYIICPPAICGITSGPGRQSSSFFDVILKNCKAIGERVAQVGPGTNVSGEAHVDDVASLALFLSKHAMKAPAGGSSHSKFFFVSYGPFQWKDFNAALARALYSRGLIASPEVMQISSEEASAAEAYY
ncbi:hypothetical protein AURDEDRAFT_159685 [Auricularia subglabra TFB-10046 SS5]|nr:hypothetical protein AURDEDRAFT_159685 [Auricularia subglabra TFB-10046 SS5]